MLDLRLSSAWARRHPHIPAPAQDALCIRVLASSLCVCVHKFYCVFFFKRFLGHLDKLLCLLEQLKILVAGNGNCASSQHGVSHSFVERLGARLSVQSCARVECSPRGAVAMRLCPLSKRRTSRVWPSKALTWMYRGIKKINHYTHCSQHWVLRQGIP